MIAGAIVALAVAVAVFVLAPLRVPQCPTRAEGDGQQRRREEAGPSTPHGEPP